MLAMLSLIATSAVLQPADRPAVIDHGVLVWADNHQEVTLFGVNYYPPFSIDYHQLKRAGVDIRREIDNTEVHLQRLGVDSMRLHCFDREISDAQGNLLDNDHLELLDYLIARNKQHGIYTVLTCIAWWPVPEGNIGFSSRFPMQQMTTNPAAWAIERRYLAQFITHENRYTHLRYMDDPGVIAFEIINEPQYPPGTTDAQVTAYINSLASAMKAVGCRKPIFYNCWGGREKAVAASEVDGATTGWYPTGLASGAAKWGNYLPAVAHFDGLNRAALGGKLQMIYEFDPADMPGSYMYPAIARDFREAGFQIANQFQYDCLALANTNVDWQTHYLNLVYAPHKTMSFAIAAKVFHETPRLTKFPDYPESDQFGHCRVSYDEDLSVWSDEHNLIYSNNTTTAPPAPARLEHVWGCGSSPVVAYQGTGAYFLDRLSPGAWRLEVYPDYVWVADPYGATAADREVSRLIFGPRAMTLHLPDLGAAFSVEPVNPKTRGGFSAQGGKISVEPGVYLLRRQGAAEPKSVDATFVCPKPATGLKPAAWMITPKLWPQGSPMPIWVNAADARSDVKSAQLWVLGDGGKVTQVDLERKRPYHYEADLPAEMSSGKQITYALALEDDHSAWTVLPAGRSIQPDDLAASSQPTVLWQAEPGPAPEARAGGKSAGTVKSSIVDDAGGPALRLEASTFGKTNGVGSAMLPAVAPHGLSPTGLDLVVDARSLLPQTNAVEVSLKQTDGAAFGTNVPLTSVWQEHRIPLKDLRHMWNTTGTLDLAKVNEIALVFGTWLYPHTSDMPHAFEIRRVAVQPRVTWSTQLLPASAGVPLMGVPMIGKIPQYLWGKTPAVSTIQGREPGSQALEYRGGPFGPPPDCVGLRYDLQVGQRPEVTAGWRKVLGECGHVTFVARAGQPHTDQVEIVFIEEDGAPWGINLPLTTDWKTTRLALSDLKFWGGWPHPANRGGPGDHLHPEHLQAVNICFGSWLYPKHRAEQHVVDIESVRLDK